ncbi:FlaD/FlaE family flagellar protein, partial [Thermococcus sp.]|uniref:FlaD/FlaE family flagellar protein n=1 Tax=Thermococcus sp. TaxID=35749 RepID=UPI00262DA7DE
RVQYREALERLRAAEDEAAVVKARYDKVLADVTAKQKTIEQEVEELEVKAPEAVEEAEAPSEGQEVVEEVQPEVEEPEVIEVEEAHPGEEAEVVEVETPEAVEEVTEIAPEVSEVGEVSIEEVPAHEVVEEKKEEGGVDMSEKLQIPEDIASLLFEEEPKKARLEKLPEDIVSTMIALKWLGFLIDRVGIQNLERVLEFYYEIGWISEEVLNQLLRYAKGTRPHHRDPEWKPAEKLTVQDHLISLLFIERLRGLKINRNVLDKLEREIKMLEKTLDEFYGI